MNFRLEPLAAVKLRWLLMQEESPQPLAYRVVPLTSGCHTPSFALEITEMQPTYQMLVQHSVPFVWKPQDVAWMDGLTIDLNRETGKFSIYHPSPPMMSECTKHLGTT